MYFYSLGWWGYEDGCRVILASEKKYTQKQFENLVHRVVKKAIVSMKKVGYPVSTISDVFNELINVLIQDYGFKSLTPTCSWICSDTNSLFYDEEDRGENEDPALAKLRAYLRKQGFTEKDDDLYEDNFLK